MKTIVLLLIFALTSNYCDAQTIKRMDDETWNAINTEVFFQHLAYGLKGTSVAVVYGGQVAYANAFGLKNTNGDPFTINTKSLLASVSKPITAVMAMRLIQNGDINLNDPISNYITGYASSGITIRHLLCHQSGIGHYDDCPGGYSGPFNADDSHDVVLDCETCLTPPGSGTIYTTFGTTLLGVIIEDVALTVYSGIFHSLYYTWLHSPGNLGTLEPAWDSSDPALAQGSEDEAYWDDIGWKLPAGGFISNITDLANFARGMLNNTFINQQTFDMMKVVQTTTGTPNHACGDLENFAFGLGFSIRGNINADTFRMSHSGDNSHGYGAFIAIYPNANAAVVILTNTGDAASAMRTIVNNIEDIVLCPPTRNFTNNISWTEPRIFEGGNITMQSELTSSYADEYIMDAENWVKLKPGFKVLSGKTFRAIVTDGCGGTILPD